MRPGPSSSKGTFLTLGLLGVLLAARGVPTALAEGEATPAPADKTGRVEAQAVDCPRCGYLREAGWQFCPACGWDLRRLTGKEAGKRLAEIGQATMGLVVVKERPPLRETLPPKLYDRLKRHASATQDRGQRKAFATAFPFGETGFFVTGARVLERASEAQFRTYNNRTLPAEIVAYDLPSGIGLLKADAVAVAPLTAAANAPSVPEEAWVVCYPAIVEQDLVRFLPQSLHRGRITATGESGTHLVSFENLVRTDHTIPPGCVGGLLVDSRGAVAGMVLGDPDPGLTYALPVKAITPIVDALARRTQPEWPYFGFGLTRPDERQRVRFGLVGIAALPVIPYVIPGSPAASSGILAGDLLVEISGERVADVADAGGRLLTIPPGHATTLVLVRGGKEIQASVTPKGRPAKVLLAPSDEIQESLEMSLLEITTGPTSQQGLRIGSLTRGGRGESAGYREGDIIVSVNDKRVRRLETFDSIVRSENDHIFSDRRESGADPGFSAYLLMLDVKPVEGERERRAYSNLFPSLLAPPVY